MSDSRAVWEIYYGEKRISIAFSFCSSPTVPTISFSSYPIKIKEISKG